MLRTTRSSSFVRYRSSCIEGLATISNLPPQLSPLWRSVSWKHQTNPMRLQDADAWSGLRPVEFLTRIFDSWIMAQHAYWAVGRGLADARSRGKQILRLKIVMDEGGWTLTPGTTKQGNPPEPTPDRLETAISLLKECGKLK